MSYYRSIVILTGAGISAESGIQTFRDSNGLWENHRVEQVASPQGFATDPELVHRFYNLRRRQLLSGDVKPNPAHYALAALERDFTGDLLLVTQNVDNLHEKAGSQHLIHMHGELLKMRCCATSRCYPITEDLTPSDCCVCCDQPGRLRPHIVWFGEMPLEMERIYQALAQCDLFIAIGTSGHVYPAAGFVSEALRAGARTVEINLEPSAVESEFNEHIYGMAGIEVPRFVQRLFKDS